MDDYQKALVVWKAEAAAYSKAQADYRARKIGDDEFLKARKKFKDADKVLDEAESKVKKGSTMNKTAVASELVAVAELLAADEDKMADEKLSSLYVKFHTWATKKGTSASPGSPISTQILKGMRTVNNFLRGKEKLTGRDAVIAILGAMDEDFTWDAEPIASLVKKYGKDEIRKYFRG
jgi:hypothetical protein